MKGSQLTVYAATQRHRMHHLTVVEITRPVAALRQA
jgi:hypothetical protein